MRDALEAKGYTFWNDMGPLKKRASPDYSTLGVGAKARVVNCGERVVFVDVRGIRSGLVNNLRICTNRHGIGSKKRYGHGIL